jgi:hypothetical protein
MSDKNALTRVGPLGQIMSAFRENAKAAKTLGFSPSDLRQRYPRQWPGHCPQSTSLLGEALGVREVAELLGCSPWTVRQKYLPQGLPHVRASATGKIVFFRGQVTEWILKRQQHLKKGGMR